jgi:hypothetical protein
MQMLHWLRRLAARFLAIGLLAATLFAVDSLTSPSPAEARCNGVNNPVTSNFYYGSLRASETPGAGTCNGNNVYSGVVKDESQDGYCVSVWFKETGINWTRAGKVCTAGNTSEFHWTDRNGNSYVYERFCMEPASDPSLPMICGWGSDKDGYGVNHGY